MSTLTALGERTREFRAMASPIALRLVDPRPSADAALTAAVEVIEDVAASCTRFDPTSPLMRANAAPGLWHTVPATCLAAVQAAYAAYLRSDGLFDPRVLQALEQAGYGSMRTFSEQPVLAPGASTTTPARAARHAWSPRFDGNRLYLDGASIDLGGIGKGLAVRWAAERLTGHGAGVMVDAGGDIAVSGLSPTGGLWQIGVENPWDPSGDPVAVLALTDAAITTSSIRIRSWEQDGVARHHLIDPRTGQPGGAGLVSVTVIGSDPADAEVMTKVAFLAGADGIAERAAQLGLAALWIDRAGAVHMTASARNHIIWKVDHATR